MFMKKGKGDDNINTAIMDQVAKEEPIARI
jgi:hypothetical protein